MIAMGLNSRLITSVLFFSVCLQAGSVAAAENSPAQQVAARACGSLLARVDAMPGTGPVFLQSYDPSTDADAPPKLAGAWGTPALGRGEHRPCQWCPPRQVADVVRPMFPSARCREVPTPRGAVLTWPIGASTRGRRPMRIPSRLLKNPTLDAGAA